MLTRAKQVSNRSPTPTAPTASKPGSLSLSSAVSSMQQPSPAHPPPSPQHSRHEPHHARQTESHHLDPHPLYSSISFSPALSPIRRPRSCAPPSPACYSKTILIAAAPCFTSLCGPVSSTVDTPVPADAQSSNTCFVVDSTGRARSLAPPFERRQTGLDLVALLARGRGAPAAGARRARRARAAVERAAVEPSSGMGPGIMGECGGTRGELRPGICIL